MIDTTGTRYRFESTAEHLWVLREWQRFFDEAGLRAMGDFWALSGDRVDRNRRSEVQRVTVGHPGQRFYLKRHTDYTARSWRHWFAATPMILLEMEHLVDYARIGFDALEPAAWGWRLENGTRRAFVLMHELVAYRPLDMLLAAGGHAPAPAARGLRAVIRSTAAMVARMHQAGFAHRDLFSWHVFVRETASGLTCHPIDLERSLTRPALPGFSWWRRRRQAGDLAALHLTIPLQHAGPGRRMRFFLDYLGRERLDAEAKAFLRIVFAEARRKGRKNKFKPFGVGDLLNRRRRSGA